MLHSQYRLDHSTGVAGGGGTTVAQGEFDFDGGEWIYTAEEWVAPNVRMQLPEGDRVQMAVHKNTVLLKLGENKVRKLKLLSTIPIRKK